MAALVYVVVVVSAVVFVCVVVVVDDDDVYSHATLYHQILILFSQQLHEESNHTHNLTEG